jgi:hypothetical protein
MKFAEKSRAFVLLSIIGILSILGMVIFSLALNVEFSYKYARRKAKQRNLTQVVRTAADLLAKSPSLLSDVEKSPQPAQLLELENHLTVKARIASAGSALLPELTNARLILIEAVPATPQEAGLVGIFAIKPGNAPVCLAETPKFFGGPNK